MAGMNDTPSGERVNIGFFGRRNAGKSSVVNAVCGQDLAVVSDVRGTTTDPVSKAMELLPLGPVVVIDTPGFDDEGGLGGLRVQRTRRVLGKTDIAVLVVDAAEGLRDCDRELIALFEEGRLPYLVVFNKSDLISKEDYNDHNNVIYVSALSGEGINELRERIAALKPADEEPPLIADKLSAGDLALLVVPIDKAAPKGRLILPQQQTIRDILDAGASALVVRDSELADAISGAGRRPDLVITDSQVFGFVDKTVPADVPLTSFSILMARHKGLLEAAIGGVSAASELKDGDRVLIAEGCTHHRQCGDIGSVKLPKWLADYTGRELVYETASGTGFPEDLSGYALVVHCGGCMLNEREVRRRTLQAVRQGVPITNYGTLIAAMHGILERSLGIFPEYSDLLKR